MITTITETCSAAVKGEGSWNATEGGEKRLLEGGENEGEGGEE